MSDFVTQSSLPDHPLWERSRDKRVPFGFDLEITARCNNDCRHCYINLSAGNREAQGKELALSEIETIASQAVELGALWVLITGGEPLLRKDFFDIYKMLKKKGLLVSVFTNACLVTARACRFVQALPSARYRGQCVWRQPGDLRGCDAASRVPTLNSCAGSICC